MISKKRKKLLKYFSGYYGRAKNCFRIGYKRYQKQKNYEFIGRKDRKSEKRRVWIVIINAFCRQFNSSYSKCINYFNKREENNIIDRKTLVSLIRNNPLKAKELLIENKQK